jgi:hypothetical protein
VRGFAFEAVAQLLCFREFSGSNLFPIIGCPVWFIVVRVHQDISERATNKVTTISSRILSNSLLTKRAI